MKQKHFAMPITLALMLLTMVNPCAVLGADNPDPPSSRVKLIFVHHSCGGHWLADSNENNPHGGLGQKLMENNYYVSATNYCWGPDEIGSRTDIPNWPEWFTGSNRNAIMTALYSETGQNFEDCDGNTFGSWPRPDTDPGGENEIIMFKSCYPNSELYGNPDDPPLSQPNEMLTVENAKAVYNDILTYFETRQDKLFIVITAPPQSEKTYQLNDNSTPASDRAANARAFNNWLISDWLDDYPHKNVAVFDYYNVLTSNGGDSGTNDAGQENGNHHRWRNGEVQHTQTVLNNFSAYPSVVADDWADDHPTTAGQEKATTEFVPLLNIFHHRWRPESGTTTTTTTISGSTTTTTTTTTTPGSSTTTTISGGTTTTTTGSSTTTTTIHTASSVGLIHPTDIEYQGAFRLPDVPGDCDWTYSCHGMTYYPDGNPDGPDDGYPGSVFASGNDGNCQHISEISIPVPVISESKNPEELNTASTLQDFKDIRGDMFDEFKTLTIPRIGLEYLPAQGSQTSGKLYFSSGEHFQDEFRATHGWCEPDLSQCVGLWKIGNYTNYTTNDYIFEIPGEWADIHTPGKYLATGRFREGIWGGRGPALYAYGPWNEGNPPAHETTLSVTPLLLYGTQEPGNSYIVSDESTAMNDYREPDHWLGGAWLTSGPNAAVIFVGTQSVGNTWYGYADGTVHEHDCYDTGSCPEPPPFPYDNRGFWAEDFEARIIFYSPNDLAAVANGQKETYGPQPYASLDISEYMFDPDILEKDDLESYRRDIVAAVSFDRARGLLYLSEKQADGEKSLIHVWKIMPPKGDMNGDDLLDLKDALVVAKILAGMPADFDEENIEDLDINNDGKIGLEELIYVLKRLIG